MRDKVLASSGVVRDIRNLDLATLKRASLYSSTSNWPLQPVLAALDSEVGSRNLVRVLSHDRWHTKVASVDLVVADLQLEVAAIIDLRPLQLWVIGREPVGLVVRLSDGDVLTVRRRRGNGCTSELST